MPTFADYYANLVESACQITDIYFYAGRLSDAITLIQPVINIDAGNQSDRVKALLQYGKLLATQNFQGNSDYETTLNVLHQAREVAENMGDAAQLGTALDLLGLTIYYRWFSTTAGDLNECLDYFRQALEKRESAQDQHGMSETLFHCGLIYQNMDQEAQAEDYYTRALQIAEQHHFTLEKSYAIRHLAFLQFGRGELEAALDGFKQSLALREAIGFRIFYPFSHIALGYVYAAQKNNEQAHFHYQQAYELSTEMGATTQVIFSLLALGNLARDQGQLSEARAHFEQALQLAESIQHLERIGVAKSRLAALEND